MNIIKDYCQLQAKRLDGKHHPGHFEVRETCWFSGICSSCLVNRPFMSLVLSHLMQGNQIRPRGG